MFWLRSEIFLIKKDGKFMILHVSGNNINGDPCPIDGVTTSEISLHECIFASSFSLDENLNGKVFANCIFNENLT